MAHISEKSLQSQGASSAIRRGARHMASEYPLGSRLGMCRFCDLFLAIF